MEINPLIWYAVDKSKNCKAPLCGGKFDHIYQKLDHIYQKLVSVGPAISFLYLYICTYTHANNCTTLLIALFMMRKHLFITETPKTMKNICTFFPITLFITLNH